MLITHHRYCSLKTKKSWTLRLITVPPLAYGSLLLVQFFDHFGSAIIAFSLWLASVHPPLTLKARGLARLRVLELVLARPLALLIDHSADLCVRPLLVWDAQVLVHGIFSV